MEACTVSEDELVRRVNENLESAGQRLRRSRGHWDAYSRSWLEDSNFGRVCVIDIYSGFAQRTHIDLESFGRELGVLTKTESLQAA